MPRGNNKKSSANFESVFDAELEDIKTPKDSLDSLSNNQVLPSDKSEEDLSTISEKKVSNNSQANKFGFVPADDNDSIESINKTYKLNEYTVRKLDSLIHKDNKNTKKIAGTKGFLSDFMDNAIWQHFYQLGLIDEEEANKHIKDYSKYPINTENFKNMKK